MAALRRMADGQYDALLAKYGAAAVPATRQSAGIGRCPSAGPASGVPPSLNAPLCGRMRHFYRLPTQELRPADEENHVLIAAKVCSEGQRGWHGLIPLARPSLAVNAVRRPAVLSAGGPIPCAVGPDAAPGGGATPPRLRPPGGGAAPMLRATHTRIAPHSAPANSSRCTTTRWCGWT